MMSYRGALRRREWPKLPVWGVWAGLCFGLMSGFPADVHYACGGGFYPAYTRGTGEFSGYLRFQSGREAVHATVEGKARK